MIFPGRLSGGPLLFWIMPHHIDRKKSDNWFRIGKQEDYTFSFYPRIAHIWILSSGCGKKSKLDISNLKTTDRLMTCFMAWTESVLISEKAYPWIGIIESSYFWLPTYRLPTTVYPLQSTHYLPLLWSSIALTKAFTSVLKSLLKIHLR